MVPPYSWTVSQTFLTTVFLPMLPLPRALSFVCSQILPIIPGPAGILPPQKVLKSSGALLFSYLAQYVFGLLTLFMVYALTLSVNVSVAGTV